MLIYILLYIFLLYRDMSRNSPLYSLDMCKNYAFYSTRFPKMTKTKFSLVYKDYNKVYPKIGGRYSFVNVFYSSFQCSLLFLFPVDIAKFALWITVHLDDLPMCTFELINTFIVFLKKGTYVWDTRVFDSTKQRFIQSVHLDFTNYNQNKITIRRNYYSNILSYWRQSPQDHLQIVDYIDVKRLLRFRLIA